MTTSAAIRPARTSDGEQLQALDVATTTEQVTPSALPTCGGSFFEHGTEPSDVLVAELDGELVGYVKLTPELPFPSAAHVLEVRGLAVEAAKRSRGVGAELIAAAVRRARERGARRVTLHVLSTNEPARRLYERSGFEVEGVQREQFRLAGGYVDDVLMALDLTRRPAAAERRVDSARSASATAQTTSCGSSSERDGRRGGRRVTGSSEGTRRQPGYFGGRAR